MNSPYLDRVVGRMSDDDAVVKLKGHWSVRTERYVNLVGYWLGRLGCEKLACWYTNVTSPLTDWLAYRQYVFLSRYL